MIQPETSELEPQITADTLRAKEYLRKQSERTGLNVYDHMVEIVQLILDKRPENAVDIFENISTHVKRSRFNMGTYCSPLGFKKVVDDSMLKEYTEAMAPIVMPPKDVDEDIDDDQSGQIPDILDIMRLFEWTGNCLTKEEAFGVHVSVRQLVNKKALKSARFWGKLYGLKAPYYVVEAEGAQPLVVEEKEEPEQEEVQEKPPETLIDQIMKAPQFQGFLKPKLPPKTEVSAEDASGCNKYAYFVTNQLGKEWIQLPDVQPKEIVAARAIRKYLTGNLEHKIESYPEFPGNEVSYLRAQIARITAATVVCPAGYYQFDPETADEENPDANMNIIVNTENEMLPNDAMLSLENWVHQISFILPQGRTVYKKPTKVAEPEEEEVVEEESEKEEEEEDGEQDDTAKATRGDDEEEETENAEESSGPPLLTPITADKPLHGSSSSAPMMAWSVGATSRLTGKKHTVIHLRSNRWPGAHAVYHAGRFASIYIGDGIKEQEGLAHKVPPLLKIQDEWGAAVLSPDPAAASTVVSEKRDLKEQDDPTVADEMAFEQKAREKEIDEQEDEKSEPEAEEEA